MKNTPAGWPRITPSVYYQDPRAAIDWLCRAFGFEVRLKVEGDGGRIEHSELQLADGLIMVGTADGGTPSKEAWQKFYASPKSVGGKTTQGLAVFVDDADAHCDRARAAGAEIIREPKTDDYGDDYWADRTYGARDPEGHLWWFMQRMREPKGHAK
jgi:uncharacterized glyoxalase superfamily protein PhnB